MKWILCRILFSMGIVLLIFSFFWTINDLVRVPPPLWGMPPFFQSHNYSHTFAHNSKTTRSIFVKFWGNCCKQHDGHEFKINTIMKNCYFWSSDPLKKYPPVVQAPMTRCASTVLKKWHATIHIHECDMLP